MLSSAVSTVLSSAVSTVLSSAVPYVDYSAVTCSDPPAFTPLWFCSCCPFTFEQSSVQQSWGKCWFTFCLFYFILVVWGVKPRKLHRLTMSSNTYSYCLLTQLTSQDRSQSLSYCPSPQQQKQQYLHLILHNMALVRLPWSLYIASPIPSFTEQYPLSFPFVPDNMVIPGIPCD